MNDVLEEAPPVIAAPAHATGLAVIGHIVSIQPIKGADFICSASIDCGDSGVWSGVVPAASVAGDVMLVFLQDAVLPPNDRWAFMEKSKWRVRMARFKQCASECVALPATIFEDDLPPGTDLTSYLGVTRHSKPLPKELAGIAEGDFPSFIPKTDETNFQGLRDLAQLMESSDWYATEKADGTSCTAYVDDARLHVCSRNLELIEGDCLYWRMAKKYDLDRLPRGLALQFEIVGPGVQGNPMGLDTNQIRVFTAYDILTRKRMDFEFLHEFCADYQLRMARLVWVSSGSRTPDELHQLAEIKYENGQPAEGIVIRAVDSSWSFKVISLLYKD